MNVISASNKAMATWVTGLAAAALISVAVIRGYSAWQAAGERPGTVVTSGSEEESIFALWRATHGEPVYQDPQRPPFAAAYFNWLFYSGYAAPLRLVAPRDDPVALIRFSRLITTVGAFAGATALFLLLRRVAPGETLFTFALTCFVFLGPLVGWWIHTIRPDVWALAFEAIGSAIFLLWYRRKPWGALLASLLLFCAAWSCKQTFVLALFACLSFLLLERRWHHFATLALASVALWLAIYLSLGQSYQTALRETATNNVYGVDNTIATLRDMITKTLPLWLLLIPALSANRASIQSPLASDVRRFAWSGIGLALPLTLIATAKSGANSNYYFSLTIFLALAAAAIATPAPQVIRLLASLAMLMLPLAAFAGVAGQVTLTPQIQTLRARWQRFESLPEPRFSSDRRLHLPWLNPQSPPLVLAYNYPADVEAGRAFENGGVGRMIEDGHFAALLLPASVETAFLGGSLSRYAGGPAIDEFRVYLRNEPKK